MTSTTRAKRIIAKTLMATFLSRFLTGKRLLRVVAGGVTFLLFILYAITMSTSYGFIDGGELTAVAGTMGIAHPSGYPTITMLGHLTTLLLPFSDPLALNIMSGLMAAIAGGCSSYLFFKLGRLAEGKEWWDDDEQSIPHLLICGGVGLLLGSGAVWWAQGTTFEVYGLHLVLLVLVVLFFLRFVELERSIDDQSEGVPSKGNKGDVSASIKHLLSHRGFQFGLVLGLAFTNHLSTIFLAPGLLFWYFIRLGKRGLRVRTVGTQAGGILVGLLPWLYLPFRALSNPTISWGDPTSPSGLFYHITGRTFHHNVGQGSGVFWDQTSYFFSAVPTQVTWVGIIFGVVGIVFLVRKNLHVALFTTLMVLTTLLWAGNYEIIDIESYYLLAILIIGFWIASGLNSLRQYMGNIIPSIALACCVALNVGMNFYESDKSEFRLVEDMTLNLLKNAPKDAVIISNQWNFWVSGAIYEQYVEGIRPDITVIHFALLRNKWYWESLGRDAPELIKGMEGELSELYALFDSDLEHKDNIRNVQVRLIRVVNRAIENVIRERPVLVTGDIVPGVGMNYERVPSYLCLRLVENGDYLPQEFPRYEFTGWDRADPYVAYVHELYARSLMARGIYESERGYSEKAKRYFDYGRSFNPDFDPNDISDFPLNGEEQIYATMEFFRQIEQMK